jgi:hypothetical protein
MKNIFLLTAGLGLALSFQSCKPDTAADDARHQQTIDSTVNARILALRDSMMMECNNMVMSAAAAYADSVMNLKSSTGKGGKKPAAKPAEEPKKDDGPIGGKKGAGDQTPVSGKKGTDTTQPKVTGKKGQQPK